MKTKLPKKISISHVDYKVIEAEILSRGCIQYARPSISVDKNCVGSDRVDTIIHEVLHGIFTHYNIQHVDDEEHVVTAMSDGITNVFKNNPDLLRYIKEELDNG